MLDPQQWNMYSFTRNNPLIYIDPDGKELRLFIWNRTGAVTNEQAARIGAAMAQKYSAAGVKNVSYSVVSDGPFRGMTKDGHSQTVELVGGKDAAFVTIPAGAAAFSDPKNFPNYGAVDVNGVTRGEAPKTEQQMIDNAVENGSHELAHSEMGHSEFIGVDQRIASPDPSDIMSPTTGSNGPFSEKESAILQNTFNQPNEVDHPIQIQANGQRVWRTSVRFDRAWRSRNH